MEEKKEKCNCRELAVKKAINGIFRGIVSCPNCENNIGYSPYDVIKHPDKYDDILIKLHDFILKK